ncbi:putative ATPase [Zygosaccharomyces mellis]|uniref:Putative ATPase n=1 Tax=Zygosaccharomyces mellis TaxID=42258 RepID=A0A4C2E1Q8_9SACH|nr:putative ATPase [Zygosaccharomyces mellis]
MALWEPRERSSRSQKRVNYKEKNENDLKPDVLASDEGEKEDEKSNSEEIKIWLRDDVKEEDVALDSDESEVEDDGQLNRLLDQAREKADQSTTHDNSDEDEDGQPEDDSVVSEKLDKLNEFVKQSQVYSGVIADTLLERSKQRQDEQVVQEPAKKKPKSITDFFKPKNTTLNDEAIQNQQPNFLENCILKPYQLDGLNWLITLYENGLNGILADDMGLGKTIQSIALLAFIYEMDTRGPFLIAAPLSTVENWINEFGRFAPKIPILKYYHSQGAKERSKLLKQFFKDTNGSGVIITSYEIIIRDADSIMSKEWKFLIVDEGHRLKNINCKLIQELKRINTSNRLLLTGTPLQNNLIELWSLLNFIMPDVFADFEIFNKWFDFKSLDLESSSKKLSKVINDELEKNLITNLHTILKPFLLRRMKNVVLAGILPPKREYLINCQLTPIQKKFYKMGLTGKLKKTIFKEMVKSFFTLNTEYVGQVSNRSIRDFISYKLEGSPVEEVPAVLQNMDKLYMEHLSKSFTNIKLQNMMIQLRQVVDSTFLFYFPFIHPEDLTLDALLDSSGKLQVLQKLVLPLVEKGHKVLIFSQFIQMLDLLEDWCELNSLDALRIDGSVNNDSRREQLEKFDRKTSKEKVFLLSTRAAGLGINLAAADTVVLFDSDWNPQVDLQAMDRCHRIGQTKPVIVYRLCCDNTVEHVILTRATSKRRLEKLVIQMGQFNTLKKLAMNEKSFLQMNTPNVSRPTNKDLVQELSQLLITGESSIGFQNTGFNDGEAQLTEQELEELTDRSSKAYKTDRTVDMPHIRLFETTRGEI